MDMSVQWKGYAKVVHASNPDFFATVAQLNQNASSKQHEVPALLRR
jgi:hypothetical protein